MDDTRLENALSALSEGIAELHGQLGTVGQRLDRLESTVATKKDVAEMVHGMTHYAKHVETMLNAFSKSSLSLEDQVDDLRKRVADLEKRIPPQAA